MKSMKIIFIALFVMCLFHVDKASAQAQQYYDYDIEVYLVQTERDTAGNVISIDTVYTISEGIEQIVVTPVGKYLRKVTFKINEDEDIMEIANPFAFLRLNAKGDFDGDGEIEILYDQFAVLTKSGNLKFVYHNK